MTILTRRAVLASAAAWAPVGTPGATIGRSRLSAITDEIGMTPAESIAFARSYRLSWVELRKVPGEDREYFGLPESELKAAAREFANHGLGVSFLNTSMLKYMLPGTEPANPRARKQSGRFARRFDELRQAAAAARVLGVDKIRIFAFSRVAEPARILPRLAEVIGELCLAAAREGVTLLLENEASTNIATCAELAALLARVPSKALGVNWDPPNAGGGEAPFPDGYERLPRERIGNVQIKGRSILPGPGRLDWAGILRRLAADGYRGKFGLETHIREGLIQASHDSMRELLRIVEAA
jgi:sugar phosphate isomerase/epimerase